MGDLKTILSALMLGAVSLGVTGHAQAADAEKGERVWKKCRSCHEVGIGAKKKVGPHLNNLMGRVAGSIEGYDYSKAMSDAGTDGLIWTDDTLDEFLTRPKSFIHNTRMSFSGLRDADDRLDLIAFLVEYSDDGGEARDVHLQPADPELPADVLAMVGDRDYGEYLSGTCVGCHQIGGEDVGIPSITGWPAEVFMTVMFSYRSKFRQNPVMQQVAGSLNNEEIAALAAYFKDLNAAD